MPLTDDEDWAMRKRRDEMLAESEKTFTAVMTLAGFTVLMRWELANGYWPANPSYDDIRAPWWLFMTELGPVQIGRRKRVIHIEWSATPVRAVVTKDEVTKGDDHVHAYSTEKAVEYLKALRAEAEKGGHDGV